MNERIKEKIEILFSDPVKFFRILISVFKARLGWMPKPPEEGSKFTTSVESQTLQKYASNSRIGIVEIGVLDGLTTKEMAEVASVPIYGIDPIIPDSMNRRLIGNEQKISSNLAFYPKFVFYKDFSFNVVKGWSHRFDFIFIDGDHNYDAVRQDFEQWYPFLETGGFLAFHDSAPVVSMAGEFKGWPGPVRLVAELKKDSRLRFVETSDSLSVFQKHT